MALVVQKFGGTSVATIDRIKQVAGLMSKTRQAGDTVVVVVSAMSGETDRLVKLAHAITEFPDEREMDMLLSTGERVTIALLAMALRAMGFDARSFTGRQVGIITDSVHTKARIERIAADRIQGALDKGIIPVVAGFQGISEKDDVTTLGRGGSDLTAVALAAALKADHCLIHTDVAGVYTADPNLVPSARRLDKVSYEEMLELANRIAKDIGARSVEVKDQIAKVSLVGVGMRSHSGVAARMFETLARERINIMMISTSEIKISCVIEEKYLELAIRALHEAFGLGKG